MVMRIRRFKKLVKHNFQMSNCSNHKKDVAGISDMKVLAEMIGDLHYGRLTELLYQLNAKLHNDGAKDMMAGRYHLAYALFEAADNCMEVKKAILKAWQISKPFMEG